MSKKVFLHLLLIVIRKIIFSLKYLTKKMLTKRFRSVKDSLKMEQILLNLIFYFQNMLYNA